MKIRNILLLLTVLMFWSACNDEWTEEQYTHYISFKAPLNDNGVSRIYIRYKPEGSVTFKLPLVISGSTTSLTDVNVHVAVDSDTLKILNNERFQNRTDFYYRELSENYFSFPETVKIPAGENSALLNIDFRLQEIDLADKWVLPLTIVDNPSYNYTSHPRKHYNKALLRIMPFNDYSGIYSGTALRMYLTGYQNEAAIVKSNIPTYVVDENTIFFYAGMIDEQNIDRKKYKIFASFDDKNKTVTFTAEDPRINFRSTATSTFKVDEIMDEVRPYLLHRYITINNIEYTFTDYTTVPNNEISYTVKGSLMMERKINTQIPDEDQAIEW